MSAPLSTQHDSPFDLTPSKAAPFEVDYGTILNCIHCGMCLPTCPTYDASGEERHSPRGRIQMIRAIADGEMEISDDFTESMDFCLGCYACETACPAGVDYSALFEAARAAISREQPGWLKRFFLVRVFTSQRRLKLMARLLRLGERSGMQRLAVRSGLLRRLAPRLADLEPMAPHVDGRFSDQLIAPVERPEGAVRHRVLMLKGCVMNVSFAETNRQTADVLLANGCEVYFPENQQCCASLHAHNGDLETARALARKNIAAFEEALPLAEADAVVVNAAGCGAFMKEYGHVLHDDPEWKERAALFSSKVRDVSEFLAHIERRPPARALNRRATYHDACHLVHGQSVTREPRTLLEEVPGLELVPLTESTWCCGSAGIYNITRYDDSMRFLERKMEHIRQTGAEWVITGNPGCILQIREGARRFGPQGLEVLHPITVLHRAYGLSGEGEE